jgi:Family of unknown function (DUF5719)
VTEGRRELVLGTALLAAAAFGIGLDALVGQVAQPRRAAPAGLFTASAVFCPPPLFEEAGPARLAIAASDDRSVEVGIEPGPSELADLPRGRELWRAIDGDSPPRVTGFGSGVVGSALEVAEVAVDKKETTSGVGGAKCARASSPTWYFPQGSTALGADERLLVANPFPDEAVVRVRLFTPNGEQVASGLTEVAVSAGHARVVRLNQFAETREALSTVVETIRGRVVAWKGVVATPERGPPGFSFTLGAQATSTTWLFPEGRVGDDADETISVLNPASEEAKITISLISTEGLVQPPKLVEVSIPPVSSKAIDVEDALRARDEGIGRISAVVQTTNGVPVVAERTMAYEGADLAGTSSEIGVTEAATRWEVGPAALRPGSDALVVMNPGAGAVRVDVTLQGEQETLTPDELRGIRVPAGQRLKIALTEMVDGEPMVAGVAATAPVAIERLSYDDRGDVGSLMGQAAE